MRNRRPRGTSPRSAANAQGLSLQRREVLRRRCRVPPLESSLTLLYSYDAHRAEVCRRRGTRRRRRPARRPRSSRGRRGSRSCGPARRISMRARPKTPPKTKAAKAPTSRFPQPRKPRYRPSTAASFTSPMPMPPGLTEREHQVEEEQSSATDAARGQGHQVAAHDGGGTEQQDAGEQGRQDEHVGQALGVEIDERQGDRDRRERQEGDQLDRAAPPHPESSSTRTPPGRTAARRARRRSRCPPRPAGSAPRSAARSRGIFRAAAATRRPGCCRAADRGAALRARRVGSQRPAGRNAVHDHVQEGSDREPEQRDEGQQQRSWRRRPRCQEGGRDRRELGDAVGRRGRRQELRRRDVAEAGVVLVVLGVAVAAGCRPCHGTSARAHRR